MLAGEYKTTTGFIRDLAEFFVTAGNSAMTRNRDFTRDTFQDYLKQHIITGQA
jgi:hypothetical protein